MTPDPLAALLREIGWPNVSMPNPDVAAAWFEARGVQYAPRDAQPAGGRPTEPQPASTSAVEPASSAAGEAESALLSGAAPPREPPTYLPDTFVERAVQVALRQREFHLESGNTVVVLTALEAANIRLNHDRGAAQGIGEGPPQQNSEPSEAQIDAAEAWYFGEAHPLERATMRPFIRGMARVIINAGRAVEGGSPDPKISEPTDDELVALGECAMHGYLDFPAARSWFKNWLAGRGSRAAPEGSWQVEYPRPKGANATRGKDWYVGSRDGFQRGGIECASEAQAIEVRDTLNRLGV